MGTEPRAIASADMFASQDPLMVQLLTELTRSRSAGSESGKGAVQQGMKIFERLAPINKSIANLAIARNALAKGAKTGAIMAMLPTVTTASVELENIRSQMGLDIVGATTFGSLSEHELEFALDTALPTKLDEASLDKWLEEKGMVQRKLRQEFISAAKFLTNPDNTIGGYLDKMEKAGKYTMGNSQDIAPENLPEGFDLLSQEEQKEITDFLRNR